MARPGRGLAAIATLGVLLTGPAARADIVNFDLSGKIYTKYMYQNDNTQGCLSISNPFWVDNIGGHNGVCTEFELNIKANVGNERHRRRPPAEPLGHRCGRTGGRTAISSPAWPQRRRHLGREPGHEPRRSTSSCAAAWVRFAPAHPDGEVDHHRLDRLLDVERVDHRQGALHRPRQRQRHLRRGRRASRTRSARLHRRRAWPCPSSGRARAGTPASRSTSRWPTSTAPTGPSPPSWRASPIDDLRLRADRHLDPGLGGRPLQPVPHRLARRARATPSAPTTRSSWPRASAASTARSTPSTPRPGLDLASPSRASSARLVATT